MVCLSIAGAFVAGAHYYVIDVPQQKALSEHPPANFNPGTENFESCKKCLNDCKNVPEGSIDYAKCMAFCRMICSQ